MSAGETRDAAARNPDRRSCCLFVSCLLPLAQTHSPSFYRRSFFSLASFVYEEGESEGKEKNAIRGEQVVRGRKGKTEKKKRQ